MSQMCHKKSPATDDLIYIDFSPRLRTSSYASTNALRGESFYPTKAQILIFIYKMSVVSNFVKDLI